MLEIRDLHVSYGRRSIIGGLTLPGLEAGGVTALVGPNATGKSTLLKALAGIVPYQGRIDLDGKALSAMSRAERAGRIGFMPQTSPARSALSVLECAISALHAGRWDAALSHEEAERRAMAVLERLEISSLALSPLDRLSGGQRQLASLAQAMVGDPRVLLLDEPTSALDLGHQAHVMALARDMAEQGRIVVAALHDLSLAARYATHVVVLAQGRLIACGSPEEVITPDMLAKVYGVEARVERCSHGTLQVIVDGRRQPM